MKRTATYIIILLFILVSSFALINEEVEHNVELVNAQKTYTAGDQIVLTFSSSTALKANLYVSNSYGTTFLEPMIKDDLLVFDLTQDLNHNSGWINWALEVDKEIAIRGSFNIKPHQDVAQIESYLGPNTIQTGEKDFAMMVLLLLDKYNNPVADSTKAIVKNQYLDDISSSDIYTSNLICYKNFYAKKTAGRALVSSESDNTYSKEYTIDILPNVPIDFKIEVNRDHGFADGNQLAEFKTSIIKDQFDNIVSDGTYVDFFIRNKNGDVLKTSGVTVMGTAIGSIVHPDQPDEWSVKAYIPGMAESNEINIEYKQAIKEFDLIFEQETGTLSVDGLKSFMNQLIPDGQRVELKITKDKVLTHEFQETARNGKASFIIKDVLLSKGTFTFEVRVAGLMKELQHTNL